MPIYAYRCGACGAERDVLQKMSDAPLTVCEACGAAALAKQVTAAGFQLKGSGWYVTDFKNKSQTPTKAPAANGAGAADAAKGGSTESSGSSGGASTDSSSTSSGGDSGGSTASSGSCAPGCGCH